MGIATNVCFFQIENFVSGFFKKMSKRIDPSTDPCGTSFIILP